MDQTAIIMNTGATLNGRALAQTAVTLDANIVAAAAAIVTPVPAPVPAPTPSATISANPISIMSGSSSSLSWSSANATSCIGTNFLTGNAISGSINVSPTAANTTYSVNCSGASASATVNVTQPVSAPAYVPAVEPAYTPTLEAAPIVVSAPVVPTILAPAPAMAAATPKLPKTGISPAGDNNAPWNALIAGGIFISLFSLYLARKKLAV